MGNTLSPPRRRQVTDLDRAILALKTQRRRIDDQRRKFLLLIERDQGAAGKLVALRQRERALLVLRMKRLHEQQLDRLDAWLLNVEAMLANMESAVQQDRVFDALAQGSRELKQLQQELSLEKVEQLMEDTADAKLYEEHLRTMMGEDEGSVDRELQELEGELLGLNAGEEAATEVERLPRAPSHTPRLAGDGAAASADRVDDRYPAQREALPAS